MIEALIDGFAQKFFGHDRAARRNHFLQIVINIVRRAEFDVNEHTHLVRRLEEFLFGNDRMKSYVVKPELFRLSEIFQIKIFERKPEKVGVVVSLCAADITSYINGLAVYSNVFTVLPKRSEAEFAFFNGNFAVKVFYLHLVSIQIRIRQRPQNRLFYKKIATKIIVCIPLVTKFVTAV